MMTQRDIENSKREACERAKAENSREVAKKMKDDGLDPAMISKYSGLTIEEINEL